MSTRARGIKSLVHDAVDLTVDLVEEGHESTARAVMRVLGLFAPIAAPARLVDELRRATTARALDAVRAVNRAIEALTDAGIDAAVAARLLPFLTGPAPAPVPMRSDILGAAPWLADAAVASVNGAVGDYLHREHNGLDLGFSLRLGDRYVPPAEIDVPGRKLAVLVHGLGTTEWSWCWDAELYHGDAGTHFGTLLERDGGYVPVFARYNSGRRVFENGRLLAEALDALPSLPDDIVLIGHSMGGLVVRSACHHASERGLGWIGRVSRVFCLGAPHRGAPLEKLGHLVTTVLGAIDHPGTRIPAELLRRRSAGIRDLRYGTVVDDGWLEPDPDASLAAAARAVPLLDHIAYYFVSATVTREPDHPLGQLVGDVLVRVPSASGPVMETGQFRIETECFGGILHHQLQNHPDVYALIRRASSGD